MAKRKPPPEPPPRAERIDWGRISGASGDEQPRRREPFRLGPSVSSPGEGQPDPWKSLLERGSMQEVLASVRRVSGLPEEGEPEPPPAPAGARAEPPERPERLDPGIARERAAPAPEKPSVPERPVPERPIPKRLVPVRPAPANVVRPLEPEAGAGGPGARARPEPARAPERPVNAKPAAASVVVQGDPGDRKRAPRPGMVPPAPAGGAGQARSPGAPPDRPEDRRGPGAAAAPGKGRHDDGDRAPGREPPPRAPDTRRPLTLTQLADGERRAGSRAAEARPPLTLTELADGGRGAGSGPADVPGGAPDLRPDLVPRRLGALPVPVKRRRQLGPISMIVVLVLALGAGIWFGFAVDADRWSLPWRDQAEAPAGTATEVSGETAPAVGAGPPGAETRTPTGGGTRAAPAVAAAEAAGAGDEEPAGSAGREAPIPLPRPRPSDAFGAGEAALGGPLVDEALEPPEAGPAGPPSASGDLAAVATGAAAIDRLAPLFLGRVYIHYSVADGGEVEEERALEIARTLEERGYRVGAVKPVSFGIQNSSVRYFFEDDRLAAARLQEDLPAPVATGTRIMDFTSYEPRPRPGTIELWVANEF